MEIPAALEVLPELVSTGVCAQEFILDPSSDKEAQAKAK